jgi:hypothetical protein
VGLVVGLSGPVAAAPASGKVVFFSGHSLINLDMPWNVQQIAEANGRKHRYNSQMGIGANMKARLEGAGKSQQASGDDVDFKVLDEIRRPKTISGASKYDALVITEASEIASHIMFTDTVPNVAAFHKAMLAGNPAGQTWLYDSWDSGGGDVAACQKRTRADHLWYQCVASAVNRDPAAAKNPVRLLPAGMMLVHLGEAIQAGKVPGLKSASVLLDKDGHHASNLGNYLLAITVYSALYGHKPDIAAVKPTSKFGKAYDGLPPAATLAVLRDLVWDTLQAIEKAGPGNQRKLAECRQQLPSRCEAKSKYICNEKINTLFAD